MSPRIALLSLSLFLLALFGCSRQPDNILLTPLALPTPTPVPPTETPLPLPPTWTPSPTPQLACGQVVGNAARAAASRCQGMALGEACLASPRAALVPLAGAAVPGFAAPGDRAPLAAVSRVGTFPFDPAAAAWGLALLRVPADPPGQSVTVALFGEALVSDAGDGSAPFHSMRVQTGGPPACDSAPLPGVLLQNATGQPASLTVNGLAVQFVGTLLVRAQGGGEMRLAVLQGQAETTADDGAPLRAPAGTELRAPLAGADGYQVAAPLRLEPLSAPTAFLPLPALPQAVAIGPPLQATRPGPSVDIVALPSPTVEPSPTPYAPFYGTPPSGAYLFFRGRRIEEGNTVTGVVPQGGQEVWVFEPQGVGPDSYDFFEVTALSDWDPVLTIESATWGVYEEDFNASDGPIEAFAAPLAGSGGNWRIIIRDALGGGGGYTLRYDCQGPCS